MCIIWPGLKHRLRPALVNGGSTGRWPMKTRTLFLPNGRRQIASWFYPMIGPYASSDRDVIDYHLLLMKYAGIDGVIVDWYGTHNVLDYPLVKRNTDSLFNRIPDAGLQFGICYEDAHAWASEINGRYRYDNRRASRILLTCNQLILAAAVISKLTVSLCCCVSVRRE